MAHTRNGWGLPFLVVAFALAVAAIAALLRFPPDASPRLYGRTIPLMGAALSFISLFVGHFSYPRVQNLKVYLSGCLVGIVGLGFFGLRLSVPGLQTAGPAAIEPGIYLLAFINGLAIPLLPSFVKYRATKEIAWSAVAAEVLLLVAMKLAPGEWTQASLFQSQLFLRSSLWIGALWLPLAVALSVRFVRREFYFGGLLAGCNLLYATALIGGALVIHRPAFESLIFALLPLYFGIGVVVHWFIRMEHRIAYDPLLHIYNREYCFRILSEQSNVDLRPPLSIAMIDIDHFKAVNDTHGHQVGDIVLREVAQMVSREVVPDGIVCRYGGEEFAVFFAGKPAAYVKQILEKARETIENAKIRAGKKSLSVTVSAGIAARTDPGQAIQSVLEAADRALYKAKKEGRNQVRVGSVSGAKRK